MNVYFKLPKATFLNRLLQINLIFFDLQLVFYFHQNLNLIYKENSKISNGIP